LSAQPLAGTEEAGFPFWSPDGAKIAFFQATKLKKIDASGGPAETLCDAQNGRGGAWTPDGTIVFTPNFNAPLWKVSAAGGAPTPLTTLDTASRENTHRWPWILPDGRHFLFIDRISGSGAAPTREAVWVGSLDGKRAELIHSVDSQAVYANGHVLFVRDRTLMAQPLSSGSRKLRGDAFPVAEHVQDLSGYALSMFSASPNGSFVFAGGGSVGVSQLAWYDRTGKRLEAIGDPGILARPRLSHDEKRIVMDLRDPSSSNTDVWVYDIARKTQTRLTFAPGFDGSAIWSPDDSQIAFVSDRKSPGDIYLKSSSGTGEEKLLLASDAEKDPYSWTADGRIGFEQLARATARAGTLWTLSVADGKASPFLASEFNQGQPMFSPDGRWIAYTSFESGKYEVYVRAFPDTGGKWQISVGGGSDPLWSRDGTEMFYDNGKRLMTVPVRTSPQFEAGTPELLFEAPIRADTGLQFGVTADGKKFLVDADVTESAETPITLVQNWLAKKR